MNNRFEFRVWYKGAYTFFNFDTLNQESRLFFENEIKNNNVEQCTGLKDKNEKLIYEGDSVKWETNSQSLGKQIIIGVITFDSYNTRYQITTKNNIYAFGKEYQIEEKIQIIGNIHENPELLK